MQEITAHELSSGCDFNSLYKLRSVKYYTDKKKHTHSCYVEHMGGGGGGGGLQQLSNSSYAFIAGHRTVGLCFMGLSNFIKVCEEHVASKLYLASLLVIEAEYPACNYEINIIYSLAIIIYTSRYPVGISTEFCFRWPKKSSRWEGEGDKGGKGKKNWGKKLKEKKGRNGKGEKKRQPWRIEPSSRVSISRSRVQCLTRRLL